MVLEREGLHLERRRQEASSKVIQRQHRVLLSWVRDDAGRQTSSAIIPHGRASRTLGKNRFMSQMTISHVSGYVDNPRSTLYCPRETVAHGEGERYGGTIFHPSAPGISAAQSVALFQCPEPRRDRGLSGPSARPPLCVVDAGSHHSRSQKLRRPHAGGSAGRALCGPYADHADGY